MNRSNLCWLVLAMITAAYLLFWLLLLSATAEHSTAEAWQKVLHSREIQHATWLSLLTCGLAAAGAVLLAVPVGYLMSRQKFPARTLVDAALDVPIILPPLVVGLCLLIFFQTSTGKAIERVIPFTYQISGVVLAQFVVAAAFAIRTMRGTFDHLPARPEEVALTLGCTRFQALWHVALPAASRGMVAAFCVAWARSLGEFGPILVFAGATRMRTEVLPTSVWLELSVGNLDSAVVVSLIMVVFAVLVLVAVRATGERV